MKKYFILHFLLLFITVGCSSDDNNNSAPPVAEPLVAEEIMNVSYAPDAEQKMDIYLPEGRNENTKVFVLVHGGSWVLGSKEDMNFMIPTLQSQFPGHAIVNIDYRLASPENPVNPMQINDIKSVISFLESNYEQELAHEYAFVGVSAGAHLSMLYSYKHDVNHDVKAVVDIVGPADFTDIEYVNHPLYTQSAFTLLGTATPTMAQIEEINPVTHITAQAPPTISFYGGQDPLVPASQGVILESRLNDAGVYNEFNFYPDGGHADWNVAIMQEVFNKTILFLQNNFE